MTVINSILISDKELEDTQTTQYTSTGGTTIIDKMTVINNNTSNVSFSCNLVANGETVGNENLLINTRDLSPKEAYNCPEIVGHFLDVGGIISTLASSSNSLAIYCSGRIIT